MKKSAKSEIGWKKVAVKERDGTLGVFILKLEIPASARRVSHFYIPKCRADKVKILAAFSMKGGRVKRQSFKHLGFYDAKPITYRVGRITKSPRWNGCEYDGCAPGIHFFKSRQKAMEYSGIVDETKL